MKSAVHIVRALLLVCALLAAATAGLFAFAPERVTAFDDRWTARHGEEPLRKARELQSAALDDPAGAIRSLDRLLAGLADVDQDDRAFTALRVAERARVEALVASGRADEGLATAEALARRSERDLETRLWAAELLARTNGDAARGVALLRESFAMLPELGLTTRALYDALVETGDVDGALDVLVHHLTVSSRDLLSMEGYDGNWSLLWARQGEPFDESRRVDAVPAVTDVYAALTFELPPDVVRVRLDPPAGARLAFGRTIVALSREGLGDREGTTDRATFSPTQEGGLETRDLEFDGQQLIATGANDPWLAFPFPAPPSEGRGTWGDGELRFVVGDPATPRWMEDALAGATPDRVETSLSRLASRGVLGVEASADRIARVRERGLARQEGR